MSPSTKISTDASVYCRIGCLWAQTMGEIEVAQTMGEIEVATAARCCAELLNIISKNLSSKMVTKYINMKNVMLCWLYKI